MLNHVIAFYVNKSNIFTLCQPKTPICFSVSEQVRRLGESSTPGEPTPGSSQSDMPLDLCQR